MNYVNGARNPLKCLASSNHLESAKLRTIFSKLESTQIPKCELKFRVADPLKQKVFVFMLYTDKQIVMLAS